MNQQIKRQGMFLRAGWWLLVCLLLASCQQSEPTPTPMAQQSLPTAEPEDTATHTPVPATNTPRPTTHPTSTAEPTATANLTPSPTATPEPSVNVQVIDENSEPVEGATVRLVHSDGEYEGETTSTVTF